MLPPEAYLRNLPWRVHSKQRLTCEALVFASDIFDIALSRLRWGAEQAGDNIDKLQAARVPMFMDAWSIVDQVHAIRLLLPMATTAEDPQVAAFLTAGEPAWAMRNAIRHLPQNVPNLAAKKTRPNPLFGALSYHRVGQEHLNPDGQGFHTQQKMLLTAGSTAGSYFIGTEADPKSHLYVGVSHIKLEAFEQTLHLDELASMLAPILLKLSSRIEAELAPQIQKAATKDGLTREEVAASSQDGNIVVATWGPGKPAL